MKSMLEKYKIHLISLSILLTITAVSFIVSFNVSKTNIGKNEEIASGSISGINLEEDGTINYENEITYEDEEDLSDITIQEKDIKNSATKDKNAHKTEDNSTQSKKDMETIEDNKIIKDTNKGNEKDSKDIKHDNTTQNKNVNPSTNSGGEKYVVAEGDTLFLIAQKTDVSVEELKEVNNLSTDIIYENQVLLVKDSVDLTSSGTSSRGNDRDDLYWMSRIIHSEAQGESYQGKVAVGNVIMNRVSSRQFPNTIKGVIFDKQNGYTQFSPVIDGSIYNTPDEESIRAAKEVLNGARPVGDALYFLNPRKSTNFWIVKNRKLKTTIGLHDFYY